MNENVSEQKGHSCRNQVELWYCTGCKAVHLGVGETRVSFDHRKFSEFAAMVADVHYESFDGGGVFDILDLTKEIDVESPRSPGN